MTARRYSTPAPALASETCCSWRSRLSIRNNRKRRCTCTSSSRPGTATSSSPWARSTRSSGVARTYSHGRKMGKHPPAGNAPRCWCPRAITPRSPTSGRDLHRGPPRGCQYRRLTQHHHATWPCTAEARAPARASIPCADCGHPAVSPPAWHPRPPQSRPPPHPPRTWPCRNRRSAGSRDP
jgi:hypothetical protein